MPAFPVPGELFAEPDPKPAKPKPFDLDDVFRIEENGDEDGTSLQRAINTGMAWKLQGSYGRAAMDAIEAGAALLGKTSQQDYWGNIIPSRYDVKEGTKGSYEYVAERFGDDYATKLLEV